MTEVEFIREPFRLWLIDSMGGDARVASAARVSTLGEDAADTTASYDGLLSYLIRNRHASPFEHVQFTFLVQVPIIVAREWFRHRTGSFNEESGRYRKMRPRFYVPPAERPLRQVGKPGAYTFERGTADQEAVVEGNLKAAALTGWQRYEYMLEQGVAKEVARDVLPPTLITSFYWTVDLRNLFGFLSLRTTHPMAKVPSFPMWEFAQAAAKVEELAIPVAPVSFNIWHNHGRQPL